MDFTETYIKMSDHPKIQEHPQRLEQTKCYDCCYVDRKTHSIDTYKHAKNIWLPRQDDIQEMMLERDFNPLKVLYVYGYSKYFQYEESRVDILRRKSDRLWIYFSEFNSFEQLWLAYYMHEKHNLIWDGEKWKKE